MKRALMFSVAVLVASLLIGTAWKVQAATPSAPAAAAPTDASAGPGYWASWADAASH